MRERESLSQSWAENQNVPQRTWEVSQTWLFIHLVSGCLIDMPLLQEAKEVVAFSSKNREKVFHVLRGEGDRGLNPAGAILTHYNLLKY